MRYLKLCTLAWLILFCIATSTCSHAEDTNWNLAVDENFTVNYNDAPEGTSGGLYFDYPTGMCVAWAYSGYAGGAQVTMSATFTYHLTYAIAGTPSESAHIYTHVKEHGWIDGDGFTWDEGVAASLADGDTCHIYNDTFDAGGYDADISGGPANYAQPANVHITVYSNCYVPTISYGDAYADTRAGLNLGPL